MITSSVTTPFCTKYCHARIGYPPSQPSPHIKPQHDKRSLTDRDTFCNAKGPRLGKDHRGI